MHGLHLVKYRPRFVDANPIQKDETLFYSSFLRLFHFIYRIRMFTNPFNESTIKQLHLYN